MLLVAQTLYGNIPSTKSDEISKVKEQTEALTNLYYLSLLSADYDVMAANSYGLRYVIKTKSIRMKKLFFAYTAISTIHFFQIDTTMTFCYLWGMGSHNSPGQFIYKKQGKAVELLLVYGIGALSMVRFYIERSDDGINFKESTISLFGVQE